MNQPERGNVLDAAMLRSLLSVYASLPDRPDVRVVVLSGAGPNFCEGVDRGELAALERDDALSVAELGRRLCEAISTADAVTVVRVQGRVAGAGLALMLACDLRLAASDTVFRLPELVLGLPPCWGGAGPRLLAEIGPARTRELVLLGEPMAAAEAAQVGLVNRVGDTAELDAVERRWTGRLARNRAPASRIARAQLRAYSRRDVLGDLTELESTLLAASLSS
ncbi:enoyl-CoA hydratase/isomerase family protein [Kitasatospora sp. NE20-6]|uniref:enoyl-CoA hydratase/isomerase family protein n=1 Tax=Kitasatospora sp. NE20-6 TaxID=2859066 RepID=UPI0038B270D8